MARKCSFCHNYESADRKILSNNNDSAFICEYCTDAAYGAFHGRLFPGMQSPACLHARVCDRTLCLFLHLGRARFGTSLVLLQDGRKGIAWAVILHRKNRRTKTIMIKQCGTLA